MPVAFFALLLSPLLQSLHFPVAGPCPRSPFSLLRPLPSLFPISLLTSLPSLLPHPVTPPSPAGNPTPSPTALTTRSATSSRRPRPGPSSTHRFGRFQPPRPPLHTGRTALFLPYPRAHRPRPCKPIWTGPNTPPNRQKNAPLHLKSFLEKTLTRANPPHFAPPTTHPSNVPNHPSDTAQTGDNQIAAPLPGRTR